ncbi:MAG: SDR family oxidoreductase [Elusimicrobia bacterium]|nr:SDR family oxidoreductase [Elusimicrobiota bacterium]
MDLKGKAALITGGARMGGVLARELARRGCHVALTYHRSKAGAEAAAESVRILGGKAVALAADVRAVGAPRRVVSRVRKTFGRLDILVNMASVYLETPLQNLSPSAPRRADPWRESLDVDLGSAYRFSLAAAPVMRKTGGGRIVNFSDWLAVSGRPRYKARLPYYVAKTGVKGLTEAMALELAPDILVNAVAPGPILPPAGLTSAENEEVIRATPLKRWGGADEVAKAVLFLVESDFVTGECLRVDGGRHLL